ncbi:hypothetical protein BpHYR1_020782, partial [Brachionus plicatilis]
MDQNVSALDPIDLSPTMPPQPQRNQRRGTSMKRIKTDQEEESSDDDPTASPKQIEELIKQNKKLIAANDKQIKKAETFSDTVESLNALIAKVSESITLSESKLM